MARDADRVCLRGFQAPLQLIGKKQVGELALIVRAKAAVPPRAVQVVKGNRANNVVDAADGDNPRRGCGEQRGQQAPREGKMP